MWDMELPSEHLPTLARVVRGEVDLRNVTGDLAPLLANLSCSVRLYNMELDAEATNKGPCVSFLGFSTTGLVCHFLADENLERKDDVTNMSGEHSRHRLEIKF